MRLPGGHRRYAEDDVERIRRVDALRAEGLSVEAAIQRVRRRVDVDPSVFAGLRRRHPELPVVQLSKRAALAVSHAIEDEHLARAEPGLLVGAFQEERHYRASEERWQELARTATTTAVLADLATTRRNGRVWEVALAPEAPLRREWVVVCDGAAPACFAGWEIPGVRRGGRRFESLWSTDPTVVRTAAELAVDVVAGGAPEAAAELRAALADVGPDAAPGHADRIAQRIVGRLDAA